jgi:hypothetical protein
LIRRKSYGLLSACYQYSGGKKKDRTHVLLGYSSQELLQHIISHPNWELVKDTKWHIDHILPISAFAEHGITDLKIINALDNLQPILASDNILKSNKYNKEEFDKYIARKTNVVHEHDQIM